MFFTLKVKGKYYSQSLFLLNKTDVRLSIKIDSFIKRNWIQSRTDTSGLKISSDGELITKLGKMCRWSHASRRGRGHECGFAWNFFLFAFHILVFSLLNWRRCHCVYLNTVQNTPWFLSYKAFKTPLVLKVTRNWEVKLCFSAAASATHHLCP